MQPRRSELRYLLLCGLAAVLGAGGASAAPNKARSTPARLSAQQIVAKNLAARGGLEAWQKVQTMIWMGHIESAHAVVPGMLFMLSQQRPNKMRFEINAMGEKTLRVFDGAQGWKLHPAHGRPDVQPYTADEVRFAQSGPGLDGPLMDFCGERAVRVSVVGIDEIDKHNAYHLILRTAAGESQHVWVDSRSFLEIRYDRPAAGPAGAPRTVSVVYRDYKTTDGLKTPSVIETGVGPGAPPDRMVIERGHSQPAAERADFPSSGSAGGARARSRPVTVGRCPGGGLSSPLSEPEALRRPRARPRRPTRRRPCRQNPTPAPAAEPAEREQRPGPRIRRAMSASRLAVAGVAILAACAPLSGRADNAATPAGAARTSVGESIYLHGVLGSGAPLEATREAGGIGTHGADAACVNCHQRSGLGSREGDLFIPPVTGEYLFHVRLPGAHDRILPYVESMHNHRDPYTDTTVARAIRDGLDSDGRPLSYLMPRFALSDSDMASLIGYLTNLGARRTPGVTDSVVHFATIFTPDSDPVKRRGVLDVLTHYVTEQNSFPIGPSPHMRTSDKTAYSKSMYMAHLRWQLHVWQLSGPASSWHGQLEQHLREEPVFAVLSGLGGSNWAPVHEFCEQNALPCLFPNVEVPVAAPGDFYSLYFSRGVLLEAELIGSQVLALEKEPSALVVDQIYRTGDSGEAAARGSGRAIAGARRHRAQPCVSGGRGGSRSHRRGARGGGHTGGGSVAASRRHRGAGPGAAGQHPRVHVGPDERARGLAAPAGLARQYPSRLPI